MQKYFLCRRHVTGPVGESEFCRPPLVCLARCLTLKGGRRIPVASRKPARAEEEDMCMYLFTMFFCIISHVILFGFPTVPPVVPRMSTLLVPRVSLLLWFPMVFYFLNVPPVVHRMSPTLPLPLSSRGSPSVPRTPVYTMGSPRGLPRGFPGLFGSSWGHRSPKWL